MIALGCDHGGFGIEGRSEGSFTEERSGSKGLWMLQHRIL